MDQSELIIKIKQDLVWRKYCIPGNNEFKPAWKFAFYNSAKKDKEGAVVIRQSPFVQIALTLITIWMTSFILISKEYEDLVIPLLLTAGNAGYTIFLYKPLFMSISATGIYFKGETYHWENFISAYICVTIRSKSPFGGLILIQQDGEYVYLDLSSLRKFNRIGTAIRDFQPQSWRNLS